MKKNTKTPNKQLRGIAGSPGICIGKAYLVNNEGVSITKKSSIKDVQIEVSRFESAVKKAAFQLAQIIDQTPDELKEHIEIIDTHVVLLKDKMLYNRTINTIQEEKVNAEWALKKVVSTIKSIFETMEDDYLKTRLDDITDVSNRILKNLIGGKKIKISKIDKRVILVAKKLSPEETSQIQLERIKGFITERGGYSSHTSIVARTLEIPAVLGVADATLNIKNDDMLIINGITGMIIINPDDQTLIEAEEQSHNYELQKAITSRQGLLPAITKDGYKLSVMGNIGSPAEIASVLHYGGDGIGLYRTEFQYLIQKISPSEDDLFEGYKNVVDVTQEMPVTIRTLDINCDKALDSASAEYEVNPALGLRAIRYCLRNTDVFKAQLRAILRAAFYGNVRILIPMISTLEEVHKTKEIISEAAEMLKKSNTPYRRDIPLGIMIEVPSAVIIADILADLVDFFSIGTNDLIQYTMAIDRNNRHVADLYQPLNPAILRMINQVCEVGKEKNIQICMCGEMAGNPLYTPILLGLGVSELSMNPQSIPVVKKAVRSLNMRETRHFAKNAIKLTTSDEIENFVRSKNKNIFF